MCLDVPLCTTTTRATQTPSTAMKVIGILAFPVRLLLRYASYFAPFYEPLTNYSCYSLEGIAVMSMLQLHVSNLLLSDALSTLSLRWLELCGHWLTGAECPCFHWLTSGVSMFPLAEALASPLPQESLNKQNSWKKHTISPAKKENNPSLHSHCLLRHFG